MFETLHDPVDVLTAFTEGTLEPLRFRWKGRVIRIRKVTGRWTRREGQTVLRFFSVVGEGDGTYELCYDPRAPKWFLNRVWNGTS